MGRREVSKNKPSHFGRTSSGTKRSPRVVGYNIINEPQSRNESLKILDIVILERKIKTRNGMQK